jgi:sec-independent protein translocase protein TatC
MLIKCIIAVSVLMGLGLVFVREIIRFLEWPLIRSGLTTNPAEFLRNLAVADPFVIVFKVGFLAGLFAALPLVLYFVGQFVVPALTKKERGYLWPAFVAGAFMFLAGAACCYYFILPKTLSVSYEFSAYLGWKSEWTIQSYYSFVTQFMIGMGLAFEVPVLLLCLVKLGVISNLTLRRFRRHFIVVIFIVAAVITPTTDILSLCLVAIPMCLLYEVCVWIAWWMDRSKAR